MMAALGISESTFRSGASWVWPPCSVSCLEYETNYQCHSLWVAFFFFTTGQGVNDRSPPQPSVFRVQCVHEDTDVGEGPLGGAAGTRAQRNQGAQTFTRMFVCMFVVFDKKGFKMLQQEMAQLNYIISIQQNSMNEVNQYVLTWKEAQSILLSRKRKKMTELHQSYNPISEYVQKKSFFQKLGRGGFRDFHFLYCACLYSLKISWDIQYF